MNKDSPIENRKIKVKTVNINIAGQLSILLSDWEKENVEELSIIGQMNGSDFKIIHDTATNKKLSFIDFSETNIVSGGVYNNINYSTKNNEFGDLLLNGCKKLEKIILPKTIVEIGQSAFWYCSNLTSLVIYSKVKRIKPEIWKGCSKLRDVKIIDNSNFHFENGILYDKNYSKIIAALQKGFYGDLIIKEGINEIQNYAFDNCKSLTSVIFPSTLTKIGASPFSPSGLTSIIFNKNIETIDNLAFMFCYQLKEVNLVETKIKTLEYGIFSYCNLETIYLPKLLRTMMGEAFSNNPLKNIFCYSNNPPDFFVFSTDKATFNNVDIKECIVHVLKGKINIYREAKGWSSFNSIIDDLQNSLNKFESKDNKSDKKSSVSESKENKSDKKSDISENKKSKINKLLNLNKFLNL